MQVKIEKGKGNDDSVADIKMTRQQIGFLHGKQELDRIKKEMDESQDKNELWELKFNRDMILTELFDSMSAYFMYVAGKFVDLTSLTQDDKDETLMEMFSMFLAKLPDYNPMRTAPTTYFRPYAYETARKWFSKRYVFSNEKNYEEMEGVIEEMSGYGTVDTDIMAEDCRKALIEALRELDDEEWSAFSSFIGVSPDYRDGHADKDEEPSKKHAQYTKVAKATGFRVYKVKKMVRASQEKLKRHPGLRAYAEHYGVG